MADVVVVGAGPNGLAAGLILARAGLSVDLVEASSRVGGALQSSPFEEGGRTRFDTGSAVHPFIGESQFFQDWRATQRVSYVTPDISFAHPLPDGHAGIAYRDIRRTAQALGHDGQAWNRLLGPLAEASAATSAVALNGVMSAVKHPRMLALLGQRVIGGTSGGARFGFRDATATSLLTGVMAHANTRLPSLAGSSVGLVLAAMAHGKGWPLPIGGAQALTDALIEDFTVHGGRIITGQPIRSWNDLEPARAVILNTSLGDAARIAAPQLPARFIKRLQGNKPGSGVFKVDFLLSEPVPWISAEVRNSPTVHVGGTAEAIIAAEDLVGRGRHPDRPYVLLVQPTVVDPSRAPGQTIVWAYCHVPAGSTVDMTERIIDQIELYAPGFRDIVMIRRSADTAALNLGNANLVGGDIGGGSMAGLGFLNRPTLGAHPWRTPSPRIYLSSSYVAPGPGIHGMGGFHAARDALQRVFHLPMPPLGPEPAAPEAPFASCVS